MKCPRCREELTQVMTRRGVVVDACAKGHGVWLDGGEIYHFVEHPREIGKLLARKDAGKRASEINCLKCMDVLMENGPLVEKGDPLDLCPRCGGMWCDAAELGNLNRVLGGTLDPYREILDILAERSAGGPSEETAPAGAGEAEAMTPGVAAASVLRPPNLALASVVVFSGLYALLFAALVLATLYADVSIHFAVLATLLLLLFQFIASPWLMDFTLGRIQSLEWVGKEQLPADLVRFVESVTRKNHMPFPRFGLIRDGTPNAFTYGHSPQNARVVLTQGLLDLLEPEELKAVVAHELGHARSWDILLMTLAGVVPVMLYYLYRLLTRGSKDDDRKKGNAAIVAAAAYLLYVVSEYVVLYLSRIREYHADRFSGEATGSPGALAGALVKIAYGLAGKPSPKEEEGDGKRQISLDSAKAFGIFDPTAARGLAIMSLRGGGEFQIRNACQAMQWDLWNPWASFYEWGGTHPLPAKRIMALCAQAREYGQPPPLAFNLRQPESYWDEFFVDLFVISLPWIGLIAGAMTELVRVNLFLPGMLIGFGAGYLIETLYAYRGGVFATMTVAALLKKIKVSHVRPVLAKLKGRVIGRGVPGLIWSEDVVLQDETGFIFADYRQPLHLIEFLFGLLRTGKFIGEQVTVTGWYRRSPIPYIEIQSITVNGKTHRCYVSLLKKIIGVLLIVIGLFVFVTP